MMLWTGSLHLGGGVRLPAEPGVCPPACAHTASRVEGKLSEHACLFHKLAN